MQCPHFDAHRCRSCALMGVPYAAQVADKQARVERALAPVAPGLRWEEPFTGPEAGFRNKAKLAVGGERGAPTLGILDGDGRGVDLRDCGLYEPALHDALPVLGELVARAGLVPYEVPRRTGELKHLIVTAAPDGGLMVRLVLRSPGQLPRVRERLDEWHARLPGLRVLSVNLLPQHKAVLEGDEEIVLSGDTLTMTLNGIDLHLRPRSFFQTDTAVAAGLYRQAQEWITGTGAASVLDLFCGVGGFALHAARALPQAQVTGVEIAADAVRSAIRSAREAGLADRVRFTAGDLSGEDAAGPAELVVVNPPRRGIGPRLTAWLDGSQAGHVLYSSCNVESLAADLAAMPRLRPVVARMFDMFPQTGHHEVAVLLRG